MLGWLAMLVLLALIYGEALVRHMHRAMDRFKINDDARQQIFPFYRYADSSLFPSDYIGDYYLALYPIGYKALFAFVAHVWDVAAFSKLLPYLLLVITVGAIGVTGKRLGGWVAAFFAMAVCLNGDVYLHFMGGGLPRAFGFPVIAVGLCALVHGRMGLVIATVWVGAAFYPVAGALMGMTLSVLLLLLPAQLRGSASDWTLGKRLVALGTVAGVAVVVLSPAAIASHAYGPLLTEADHARYPETARGGRYDDIDVAPWEGVFGVAPGVARSALVGKGKSWSGLRGWLTESTSENGPGRRESGFWWVVVLLTALGWLRLMRVRPESIRIVTFAVSALVGYELARMMAPYIYLPMRYLTYSVPVVCALTIPAGLVSLSTWVAERFGRPRVSPLLAAVLCLLLMLFVASKGHRRVGIRKDANRFESVFAAIEAVPPDSLVAGFPRGVMDYVPYFTSRQVLVTYETHQVFHERYLLEMRRRMGLLLEAYFATSLRPVRRLRDELGVTHLLVNTRHFGDRPPSYFEPFGAAIESARADSEGRAILASEAVGGAVIFEDGTYRLLDLSRLPDGSPSVRERPTDVPGSRNIGVGIQARPRGFGPPSQP